MKIKSGQQRKTQDKHTWKHQKLKADEYSWKTNIDTQIYQPLNHKKFPFHQDNKNHTSDSLHTSVETNTCGERSIKATERSGRKTLKLERDVIELRIHKVCVKMGLPTYKRAMRVTNLGGNLSWPFYVTYPEAVWTGVNSWPTHGQLNDIFTLSNIFFFCSVRSFRNKWKTQRDKIFTVEKKMTGSWSPFACSHLF